MAGIHVTEIETRLYIVCTIQEPESSKRYTLACVPIEDSDQPAHPRSLIRVFDGRSMGSKGSNVSSGGKLRLWSDCEDTQTYLNLHYTHTSNMYVKLDTGSRRAGSDNSNQTVLASVETWLLFLKCKEKNRYSKKAREITFHCWDHQCWLFCHTAKLLWFNNLSKASRIFSASAVVLPLGWFLILGERSLLKCTSTFGNTLKWHNSGSQVSIEYLIRPQVYKKISCSTQLSTKFIMPIKDKVTTIASMKDTTSESMKARKVFIFQHFIFCEQLKFHA